MKAMKVFQRILFLFLLAGSISVVSAQDIITQKNGDEIKAKVTEIGANSVKYKRFGNESGPTYTISKSEIFMIKYENGEKDIFEAEGTATQRTESVTANEISNQTQTQYEVITQPETTATKPPVRRKGYVGLGIGGAFMTESYDNVDGGFQVNINFGYLFSKNIGITSSFFDTSFDLSNYKDTSIGLTGFLVGPMFSTATTSEKVEFDLRPMIGVAFGSVTVGSKSGTTDETVFSFGVGGSVRWNCASRISISGNVDYYRGEIDDVDLSSVGITAGVNFRF